LNRSGALSDRRKRAVKLNWTPRRSRLSFDLLQESLHRNRARFKYTNERFIAWLKAALQAQEQLASGRNRVPGPRSCDDHYELSPRCKLY
jgi:hypothetical protein